MIGGERQLRDRNPISLGPAPADARRNAARVQADVDLVNTNIDLGNIGGGGGLTEVDVNDLINAYVPVTGGVGNVIGVPVGTPYLYVGPNLTQLPIDISSAPLDLLKSNAYSEVDTHDATGLGADTVCMVGSGTGMSSRLIGFNTAAGTASAIGLTERPRAFVRFGTDRLICEAVDSTSTQRIYWINNGVLETFTLAIPATGYRIAAVGPAANGTDVLVVWMVRNTNAGLSTYDVYVRTYDTAGNLVSTQTTNTVLHSRQQASSARVDNGYIVLSAYSASSLDNVYVKSADTTSAWQYVGAFDIGTSELGKVTSSGHAFARADTTDLLRINCATGAADVYPNTFVNDEGSTHGIYSISSTKVVVTGVTTSSSDPFVDTIVISGGSANVTQTVITSDPTATACFQPVALPSGDVVFGILGFDATTGFYELLVSVAGP